ncbi:MAG: hypothetical protein A3F16_00710 [Deltaproteobacteria bacterium RIFCSPHIGHO2_12_FULL_43_9]|nr:MAG: hypothetical protein A3F16_00710 [Deltaproteobacteria bacterium RIFCSPHIGHO2_12_FULL_43_9]
MNSVIISTVSCKEKLYGVTSNEFAAIAPNIPMAVLASHLEKNDIPVHMIDADADGYDNTSLIEYILKEKPIYVCLIASGANPSASTMTMVGIIDFCNRFYEHPEAREITTVIWGGHPSVLPERTLRETKADFVIKGEGYETLTGLYEHYRGVKSLSDIKGLCYFKDGKYTEHEAAKLVDLKDFPTVNWDSVLPSKYRAHNWHCFGDIENRSPYAILWTSFGCPYPCNFCSINNVFLKRTMRFRSIDNVIAEIDKLVNEHGVKNIKILDELFILKHPRLDEFCDKLGKRNYALNMWAFARIDTVSPRILERLKKVGLNWIAYGIETVDPKVLHSTTKRFTYETLVKVLEWTRDAGIYICADVIFGLWDDNYETLNATRNFLYQENFEWINVYPGYAYPGTPLYDEYINEKRIEEPKSWEGYSLYGYNGTALPTKYLTSAEVLRYRDDVFSKYYLRPAFLKDMEVKFGLQTREHIERMAKTKLSRSILDE